MRRIGSSVCLVGLVVVTTGCPPSAETAVEHPKANKPAPEPPKLELEFGGCLAVRDDGACLASGSVQVWARSEVQASVDLVSPSPVESPVLVQGGYRWTLAPPTEPANASVRACRTGQCTTRSVRISPVDRAWTTLPTSSDDEVRDLTRTSSTAEACLGLRQLGIRRRHHHPERSLELWERAATCYAERGFSNEGAAVRVSLSWLLHQRGRFTEAEEALEAAPEAMTSAVKAHRLYVQGLLARDLGNLRAALVNLREARIVAERMGDAVTDSIVSQVEIPVLQQLGRSDDALKIAHALKTATRTMPDGRRAQALTNLAWAALLEREGLAPLGPASQLGPIGPAGWPDPMALQQQAIELHSRADQPRNAANGELNLALAAIHERELDRAEVHIDRADPTMLNAFQTAWRFDLRNRLALLRGEYALALKIAEEMKRRSTDFPYAEWRALIGAGQALEGLGREREALERYLEAEKVLNREAASVSLGQGKLSFASQRSLSARLAVDVAARLEDWRVADEVARVAQARTWQSARILDGLDSLTTAEQREWNRRVENYVTIRDRLRGEARSDWTEELDELERAREERERLRIDSHRALRRVLDFLDSIQAAPVLAEVPDDLTQVTYFPGRTEWFAITRTELTGAIRTLGQWQPSAWDQQELIARRLLEPIRGEIASASRLRFISHQWLQDVDLHWLPFESNRLMHRMPVTYASDIGSKPHASDEATERYLIVADPTSDLPGALTEAKAVAKIFRGRPHSSVQVLLREDATSERVLEHLPKVDVFHYAGHAQFEDGGLESALVLANGQRLTSADILALPSGPTLVVLSGCETSRLNAGVKFADIGLAQSFLLRGAETVVATTRVVRDAVALSLVREFYAQDEPAPEALRRAQIALSAKQPNEDWGAFRVLVP